MPLDILTETLTGELVKYACGRAIFCPGCEVVLDCRDAVLYTPREDDGTLRAAILCGACSDTMRDSLTSVDEALLLTQQDIYDGREIFAR